MPVRTIIQLGHPTLWEKAVKIESVITDDIRQLITDLRDTLSAFREKNGYGRGIAAPQVDVLRSIIYVIMPEAGLHGPLINPEIVYASKEQVELWDDCFSFPDLKVKVSRAKKIEVMFFDEHGTNRRIEAEGDLAELLQHEIDHLNGILAVDRAKSARDLMTRLEWERRKKAGEIL